MPHVAINDDQCRGHGRCALISSDVFDLDDNGQGRVLLESVPPELVGEVREAVMGCPEDAINLSD